MRSDRLAALALVAACASVVALPAQTLERAATAVTRFYVDDPLWTDEDMRTIAEPGGHELSKTYDFVSNSFGDTARSHGPALNVNTLGEVPDSSWFTNRIGRHELTTEDVVRGPNQVDGPAPGIWQVTGRPDAGITPKFTIRDARGDTYLIKLDPASNPELPSSVEIIGTKIFHAIGYHVPEDYLVTFDITRLAVAPNARIRNSSGDRVPIDQSDLERWLRPVPKRTDGTIRAIASRFVPGRVVGQFAYAGQRPDDPNDLFPHERRRELRGLRVFAAWLNHDDARSLNSIDAYVTENGRRYIRHYLQDFGSTLGSGSTGAQQPRAGYEYLIEPGEIAKGVAGFGFYERPWMKARWPRDPSLGNIEAERFDPATWKTEYPNPAFVQMDAADAFWAGRIVSRFTDTMIRGVVEEARLSNADAAAYLASVIIARRDKTVRWAVTQANPLDGFEVDGDSELTFENAAVRLNLVARRQSYRIRWSSFDNRTGTVQAVGEERTNSDTRAAIPGAAWGPADDSGARYASASIATIDSGYAHWAQPVVVTLRNRAGAVDVVGIDRRASAR